MDCQGFYDVFPEYKSDTEGDILKDATITRVSTCKKDNSLRIYLSFNMLVPKRAILKLEKNIKKQFFSNNDTCIKIIESFNLSSLYTPKNLMDAYRDSILEELDNYSSILFSIFKNADFDYSTEGKIVVILEDSFMARQRQQELADILFKILCQRCNQSIIIDFDYKEARPSNMLERNEEAVIASVKAISDRVFGIDEIIEKAREEKTIEEEKKPFDPSMKKNKEKSAAYGRSVVKSDNPDCLYGREFTDESIPIVEVIDEIGETTIRGQILSLEMRPIKNEKTIAIGSITDFTDTIGFKVFLTNAAAEEFESDVKVGEFVKLKGIPKFDKFDNELSFSSIYGIMKIKSFLTTRMEQSTEKRVELHCHTKMSEYDGVSEVQDILKRAKAWGHKALAVTDHGVVQAFPDAHHFVEKNPDFKVIYGCEIYLVDDTKLPVTDEAGQNFDGAFVVFDIETTGFNASKDRIIEIGAVKIVNNEIVDRFSEYINPQIPIPYRITELTTITDDMVIDAPTYDVILPRFVEFCKGCVLVAHNADFDTGFIKEKCKELGIDYSFTYLDTVATARYLMPDQSNFKLHILAKALDVHLELHHRAVYDAECTALIFLKLVEKLKNRDINDLAKLNEVGAPSDAQIKKMHPNHCILLAKNDLGRINLYRLVSESHIRYFQNRPKVPKSLVDKYRDGLIIGSACSEGELYDAILLGRPESEIIRIANWYDYLEIQPVGNNGYMIREEKYYIENDDDLREINKKIVALGEELNKPVCATCDVHFLDPEDEIYRRFIQASKGFNDADMQPPIYLHTTEEMLEEFAYLGLEKAHEVVIDNTNMIADMIENISPVRPDKCPPVIEDSDLTLRKICYDKAHSMYGPELPEVVAERLERELKSIIGNGYAVMYIIAQKLVWKSVEDGYLVGSRGSVGSSFVATMAGITEVNPLSAHYLCDKCYYVDFDSDEVKAFSGRGGCDMPDKLCPKCGNKLSKHGFDIPFETFLGFKGDKEPDIDLNFSGDYQSKAHRYTEVIFGDGQTFKAGTIGTVAEKTAYGMVKKYYEEHGVDKRKKEVERLLVGCTGVKNTTGQHPGGIIVLPVGEEIYSFTPIQHPANKDTDIVTTHFDYHSIDTNLLKLDILGHADPTMIRRLEELIGFDATTIPLDDKGVMSLFQNTEALGVTPDDLMGTSLGTLGIPEFGTDFAMQMLIDAKPTEFSDLVRIAGLAHGTDVWLGNAKDLILSGKATISTAICTRDDIMTYLIHMGLDPAESFTIMERVRKGTVAKGKCDQWPEYKAHMLEHNVPEWYVESCEKIKYMFPKAHAVAYVMMAWRVAYCKINYPLEFYAAFFSIRADNFDCELMCQGQAKVEAEIKRLQNADDASAKDEGTLKDLRIVQEMYARGFEFLPIDLYESDSIYFKIKDGKLLPSFVSIAGMGGKAAEMLAIAAKDGPFLSKQDIKDRGKVSAATIEALDRMGVTAGMSESNQLSLFDFA